MVVVWTLLAILIVLGAGFSVALAALEYWMAFLLFLIVFVFGVVALSVQAVMMT